MSKSAGVPDSQVIKDLWERSRNYRDFQKLAYKELGRSPSLTTVKRWIKRVDAKEKDDAQSPVFSGEILAPDALRGRLTGRRYVFTCAQNNTAVHENFLKSLLVFCKAKDAQLIIGRITYNKAGFQNGHKKSEDLEWDTKILPYVLDESMEICPDLIWCGEMNILPTAVRPLSGLESYCRHASGIVPHTKVAMESVPRMKGYPPKFMYTTGAITKRNYVDKRAGQRAAFHHVFGALYIEIDAAGCWFARQLIATNAGDFYDLDTHFTPNGAEHDQHAVMAINLGDLHAECQDQAVMRGIGNMLYQLNPAYLFLHDVSDFRARNHHTIDDPYIRALTALHDRSKQGHPRDSVGHGLSQVAHIVSTLDELHDGETIVVSSNHDDALLIWLRTADYRKDPINAVLFLKLQLTVYKKLSAGISPYDYSLLGEVLKMYLPAPDKIRFLAPDESFRICETAKGEGIECGIHGHRGANGRWGRPIDFTRFGCKCNTGHTHTAGIIDGVYTAGVSCPLDMGYNKGATSWSHSHIITYKNGKRCIITQRGELWRA